MSSKSFWEKTKEAATRGVDRSEKRRPGTRENMNANLALTSSMAKGVYKAHGIDSVGAGHDTRSSGQNTSSTYQSSSHGPRFGEEGTAGRYPQGVDRTTQQPVAQSSTGGPYEVNTRVQVDPNNTNWTPSKFR